MEPHHPLGNQGMKDGQTRDRLAQELCIFCFRDAGLLDQPDCLYGSVESATIPIHIRNKQWQVYAAFYLCEAKPHLKLHRMVPSRPYQEICRYLKVFPLNDFASYPTIRNPCTSALH
jgi:hypothetical protein